MKYLIAGLAFILLSINTNAAYARGGWGSGFAVGILGGIIIEESLRPRYYVPPPPPVYYAPPVRYRQCYNENVFDQWGRYIGIREVCR